MKKQLIMLMMLIPTLAFANLGDTHEQSDALYGEPMKIGQDTNLFGYLKPEWMIVEWFNPKGIVESIMYIHTNGQPIAQDQLDEFCKANNAVLPTGHWTKATQFKNHPEGVEVIGLWTSLEDNLRLELSWDSTIAEGKPMQRVMLSTIQGFQGMDADVVKYIQANQAAQTPKKFY